MRCYHHCNRFTDLVKSDAFISYIFACRSAFKILHKLFGLLFALLCKILSKSSYICFIPFRSFVCESISISTHNEICFSNQQNSIHEASFQSTIEESGKLPTYNYCIEKLVRNMKVVDLRRNRYFIFNAMS